MQGAKSGPLAGVTVLDLTQVMAGSYCSMLLADMGADVLKIEKPAGGDDTRRMGRFMPHGESPAFMAINRNKRGMVLDLADPRGADVMRRLVLDADVLVENFRPGTMQRFGLGYEALHELNPALVYTSISGFGSDGPYAGRGGFDLVAQGMSGLMSMTGEPGGAPAKVGVPICDLNAGLHGAFGTLAAYVHRVRTGEGQHVDTSLLEAGIATTVWETALWDATGAVAQPNGSAHRLSAPYEALPTGDGYITIGAANQRAWERLCEAVEATELLEDDRFREPGERLANREVLAELLADRLRDGTTAGWVEHLGAAGVPCGPLYDIEQVYADPQVQARRMLVDVEHPTAGTTRQIGVPVKLSGTPAKIRRPAPRLGEHSRQALAEHGFADAEIAELIDQQVVGQLEEPEPTGGEPR
jgi:crotonobetainyl-CoA:carnitine CoA-transferase CaiB-like acyl-CoA transferase